MLGAAATLVSQVKPDWRDLRKQAKAAYEAKDYGKFRDLAGRLWPAMNGHPSALYTLACAEALSGQHENALRHLALFAETGLLPPVESDPDLASVVSDPAYAAIQRRMRQNARLIEGSQPAFEMPDPEIVPEDIGFDATTHTFYFTSLRLRKVIQRSASGRFSDFVKTGQDHLWAAFGVAIDSKRRILWVSTAATPELGGIDPADAGHSAVLQYAVDSGKLIRRYELPSSEGEAVLGDIAIDASGDLIASNAYGTMYRARKDADGFEPLAPRGILDSPQQPVPLAGGQRVLVADYLLGIGMIDIDKKTVSWLPHPDNVSVDGIDGLYRYGDRLLAIQNGTNPLRVVAYSLDAKGERITGAAVLEQKTPYLTEPTHGVVVGSDFFFIANSESDKLDAGGKIKPGEKLEPAKIRRLSLTSGSPQPINSQKTNPWTGGA